MNKTGFTLVEVLTTVVIIGVLTSIALPRYVRAIERARATEAMSALKAMNDSVYAFFAEKNTCPTSFNQLVVKVEGSSNATHTRITSKFFRFDLAGATGANVPGTDCAGVLATRNNGGSYAYTIWNPYTRGTTGKALALQCAPTDENDTKSRAICESLGLYREPSN